jgi:hypothetical protein
MTKQVWTYTKLAERAMRMARSNPDEFQALRSGNGSSVFLPGCFTHWRLGGRTSKFDIYVNRHAPDKNGVSVTSKWRLASILGNKRNGRMYSAYFIHLTPKHFRKREVEKLLPISLPGGVTCDTHTQCNVHRVDGTVSRSWKWAGGGRGNEGRMINNQFRSENIVYDDTDGDLVGPATMAELRLYSAYQNGYYDLGWHPVKPETRRDWINSILSIPGIDQRATLESALRACKVATELTAEHPAIGMMLLPARPVGTKGRFLPNGSTDDSAKVDWPDDAVWYLPKVLVYWLDYREQNDGEAHWTTMAMTIPPHGHEGLDPRGKLSPLSGGYITADRKRMAYHDLVCWKLGAAVALNRTNCHCLPGEKLSGDEGFDCKHITEGLVFWPDSLDKVHVCCTSKADKPVLPPGILYGATPDEVKNLIESKFVIDSLPML